MDQVHVLSGRVEKYLETKKFHEHSIEFLCLMLQEVAGIEVNSAVTVMGCVFAVLMIVHAAGLVLA